MVNRFKGSYEYGMNKLVKTWRQMLYMLLEKEEVANYIYENCVEWVEPFTNSSYFMEANQYPLEAALFIGDMGLAENLYKKGYEWRPTNYKNVIEVKTLRDLRDIHRKVSQHEMFGLVILRCVDALTKKENKWVREFLVNVLMKEADVADKENLVKWIPIFCCCLEGSNYRNIYRKQERYFNVLKETMPDVYQNVMQSCEFRERLKADGNSHPSQHILPLKRWLLFAKDANIDNDTVFEYQDELFVLVQKAKEYFTEEEYRQLLRLAGADIL